MGSDRSSSCGEEWEGGKGQDGRKGREGCCSWEKWRMHGEDSKRHGGQVPSMVEIPVQYRYRWMHGCMPCHNRTVSRSHVHETRHAQPWPLPLTLPPASKGAAGRASSNSSSSASAG